MTATSTLEDRLTALILTDPDVRTLYSAQTALVDVAAHAIDALVPDRTRAPKILVSETDAGTKVTVSVGVTGEHSATRVCRDLHDRIAAELPAADANHSVSIAVKIASIA